MGKLLILSVPDHEEHILDKIMELIADEPEFIHLAPSLPQSALSFPGLEIRLKEQTVYCNSIVFKATNRNYTIIFITYNESSVIPTFPTCSAVFTGIRLPPYLSKLVNMVPWQKAINIGFTHFCATPARDTALSRWATA